MKGREKEWGGGEKEWQVPFQKDQEGFIKKTQLSRNLKG